MSRIPGLYPLSVAAIAGLAGWAAYGFGKGTSDVAQIPGSTPKPAITKEASSSARGREARPVLDLAAEIGRMCGSSPVGLESWDTIRSLSLEQVEEALEIALAPPWKKSTSVVREMLLTRWAELDPEQAMAKAVELQEGEQSSPPGKSALWTWAQQDPEAARRWAATNPEAAKKLGFIAMLSNLCLKELPAVAMEKAALWGTEVHSATMYQLASMTGLNRVSRPEFLKLLEAFPEDRRDAMRSQFVATWCASDPEEGLEGLKELIPDEGERNKLRDQTLRFWSRSQPSEVLAWIEVHPQETKPESQAYAWREWVGHRPEEALSWLEDHGDDARLAEAIVRHLQSYGSNDPFSASVIDQKQKDGLRRSYQVWAEADPDAAAKWLRSADPQVAVSLTNPSPEPK
ncbi:hypothetical protein [Luteolibacter luteus]|uniref:Uncharacterized protein n=1 Tax=Luteolibacter luteus TaxID=2728835 RepID=A0A858RCL4_9BACT|nr:hypothetical protein [Luteolibacter luteus]QJE94391.1 hypothetical protein HHL09_00850 [Luteolibacter luteus]